MANINGWGRGAWGEGSWGTALPVTVASAGAITSAQGAIAVYHNAIIEVGGLGMLSAIGSASTAAAAVVSVVGIASTVRLGAPLVYGEIDTSQDPNYNVIDDGQSPGWAAISSTQTPGYSEIDAGRDAA